MSAAVARPSLKSLPALPRNQRYQAQGSHGIGPSYSPEGVRNQTCEGDDRQVAAEGGLRCICSQGRLAVADSRRFCSCERGITTAATSQTTIPRKLGLTSRCPISANAATSVTYAANANRRLPVILAANFSVRSSSHLTETANKRLTRRGVLWRCHHRKPAERGCEPSMLPRGIQQPRRSSRQS